MAEKGLERGVSPADIIVEKQSGDSTARLVSEKDIQFAIMETIMHSL